MPASRCYSLLLSLAIAPAAHAQVVTTDIDPDYFWGPATVCDGDCNDGDPAIHPGAVDTPGDGVDQNCDGADATSSGTDTGGNADTGSTGDGAGSGTSGCGCSTSHGGLTWLALLPLLVLLRRRSP